MSRIGKARRVALAGAALTCALVLPSLATGETVESALMQAYQNNPTLNSQRAGVRAVDEGVPQALAGYRPRVNATFSGGEQYTDVRTRSQTIGNPPTYSSLAGIYAPYGASINATQTLFNGFQTANKTRQAEAQVFAARETLRTTEQNVMLSAVTAYMNLLRDAAILDLQKRNVEVLQEQLRQVRDRFNVGEVTRTDVAQSESRIAAGRSQVLTAEANYKTSAAIYRQVIGNEAGKLTAGAPVDRFSPSSLTASVEAGNAAHPTVTSAQYNVDFAEYQVKIAEGALLPTFSVTATASRFNQSTQAQLESTTGSVISTLTVPIYQGGAEYSAVRQAKETLGQRRIDLDTARDQARQTVVQSWGLLEAAKGNILATQSQVQAAEVALNGVREEARVGQRTTLDVLNAQQELVNARVALVGAQRDRVVASYTLLAAVGRLSPQVLGLRVSTYDAQVHYHQVRDTWTGLRTPDGR
ncbi:MAG: TolC family outer membrane protein [Pseudolabrys sp.]|nr:TolC family outer membrane protein [Pseudolabrys sp.]